MNEAHFAIGEGVGTPEDVDAGLELGLNHPRGPVSWGDQIGLDRVQAALEGIWAETPGTSAIALPLSWSAAGREPGVCSRHDHRHRRSALPDRRPLLRLRGAHKLLIGGDWVDAAAGETFETIDPATGEVIGEVAHAGPRTSTAPSAAARRRSTGSGRSCPPRAARLLMHKLADLIEADADELAELEALDNGKPVTSREAVDVPPPSTHLRYYAGWPTRSRARRSRSPGRTFRLHAQGAGRRVRPDHPVELPAADGGLEAGAGARRRLHASS